MKVSKDKKSSIYKGVTKITKVSDYSRRGWLLGKFTASLHCNGTDGRLGKKMCLGLFDTERDAALARDKKILSLGLNEPLQILKPKI